MSAAPTQDSTSSSIPDLHESKNTTEQVVWDQSDPISQEKRRLLELSKKKEGVKVAMSPTSAPAPTTLAPSPPLSPPFDGRPSPRGSPRIYPSGVGASPSRRVNRSSSPGLLHSPASSQIFERNVQESVSDLSRSELSSHLPTHITTEDHIPPVLEASSLAITDDHLNPDEVEIVMHSAHQPAAAAVTGRPESVYSPSQDDLPMSSSGQSEIADGASNYASLDTTDVRRLSFISFADVVQAEHVENDREAMQFMSLSETANRSPSPVRSPTSSHGFGTSPPTSGAASEKGTDLGSPKILRAPGSPPAPGTQSPPLSDLHVETMRQALRKTGNGEFEPSAPRSQPLSALSLEDNLSDQPPFKP
ncbi:hypothetical protein BU24DRAFT_419766 [Aaosphaeria arxii CBS 175.79]|uniref:Uncharacterized protein n=1 Tax=Aaosphaeria arxii CBS 175.79 TaxID=1450172 RepID=A0A6A5Y3S8_9PLEO|nr:uncharacterized protein BU24DRAFT_419766 [Aaosphaeria arxii CBS 175.79]KAF2020192.1 hypothetical protein BU24DRAFT_419766 [Aaosphaeria arxii CBS 175.79]